MRRNRGSVFVLFVGLAFIIYFNRFFDMGNYTESTVLASVNDVNITKSQLRQFATNSFGVFDESRTDELLEIMINHEILLIHAEKSGIAKNILYPQFEKQEHYAREGLMLEMFLDLEAESIISVDKTEIENYYNTNVLFILRAMQFFYSEDRAEEKSRLAVRELNRFQSFEEVFRLFNPNSRTRNPGFIGVINHRYPPDYLVDFIHELNATGSTTTPFEDMFGYVIYYRDARPTFSEAHEFILRDITNRKTELYKENRLNEITRNNRINMFNVDSAYFQGVTANRNEVLITNRLTNSSLTAAEIMTKLSDVYNIRTINSLTYEEFQEYINLLMSQKVILDLAEQNGFFDNRRFVSRWQADKFALQANQKQETIDYMVNYIHDNVISRISDQEIIDFYNRNGNLFRRSDFFKLQTIILNDRTSAMQVYHEAINNTDFNRLVMMYSNDPYKGYTRGISPFLDRNQLEKSYDSLFNSRVGDIVPPIEMETNIFHVNKIIDRVQGALRPVNEVIQEVTTGIMQEKSKEYIRQLIRTHRIDVVDKRMSS